MDQARHGTVIHQCAMKRMCMCKGEFNFALDSKALVWLQPKVQLRFTHCMATSKRLVVLILVRAGPQLFP